MQRTRILLADLLDNQIRWLQEETVLLNQVLADGTSDPLSRKLTVRLAAAAARMAALEGLRVDLMASVAAGDLPGP